MKRAAYLLFIALASGACASSPPPSAPAQATSASASSPPDALEVKLAEVARVHGAPGPWAVAGYRMSEYALQKLGLPRGSFDLQVTHHTPQQVKYSCIADGAQAYSGASPGKLNLTLVEAKPEEVVTEYRNKKTGQKILLKPAASFQTRYADTPRNKAHDLGREVMLLPADQVFEEVPST
ncbi:MAG: formylmethanofuran dehydrogenase subunit E family protein [Labilithrix sp.]